MPEALSSEPQIWKKRNGDHVYVALGFTYLVAANADCDKTWFIPEISNEARNHHISLGTVEVNSPLLDKFGSLEQALDKSANEDKFMKIAKWQSSPDSTMFYFKGAELIDNLFYYLQNSSHDESRRLDKNFLIQIINPTSENYHVTL